MTWNGRIQPRASIAQPSQPRTSVTLPHPSVSAGAPSNEVSMKRPSFVHSAATVDTLMPFEKDSFKSDNLVVSDAGKLMRGVHGDGGTLLRGSHVPRDIEKEVKHDDSVPSSPTVGLSRAEIASLDLHEAALLKEVMIGLMPVT